MIGTIVRIRRKCCGLGRSDFLGSVEKFFSSFDSELRFLVYSLVYSFINEFMEVRVGGRSAQVTGDRTSVAEQTHAGRFGEHMPGRGMKEWNTQQKDRSTRKGQQRWDLFSVALPAAFWLWDELANLGDPINSHDGDFHTLTSPFVSPTSKTAWLHYHILSGVTIHLLVHSYWEILNFI